MRFTRDALLSGELVVLVTITYAGRAWRFSTRPIDLKDDDGNTLQYDGGLDATDLAESIGEAGSIEDMASVSLSLRWPVDLADLVERGHDLGAARGEVAVWLTGTTWEKRRVVVVGPCVEPIYGDEGEPVDFSIQGNPWDDAALIPDPAAAVNATTWPTADSGEEGKGYPIPFGSVGRYYDQTGTAANIPGSPALIVEMTGSNADTLLVSGVITAGTAVTIHDGSATQGFTAAVQNDGLGRACMVVDITTPGSISRTAGQYWATWTSGSLAHHSTSAMTGAGDLLEYLLDRSTLGVDRGRVAAAKPRLNMYRVAGYVDDPSSPWDIIQDQLLPILPISFAAGPSGIFPVFWRYDATSGDAVEHLEVGRNCVRTERVKYHGRLSDVINDVTVKWAQDDDSGEFLRYTRLRATADPSDPDDYESAWSKASASRLASGTDDGTRGAVIETPYVWRADTAARIAYDVLSASAFVARTVALEGGRDLAWLERGSVVLVTDSTIYLSSRVGLISEIGWLADGGVALTVRLLEDPTRDARRSS